MASNEQPVDLRAFESAMPEDVRAAIAATPWATATRARAQIAAALEMLGARGNDRDVTGWIVGMTMFVDPDRTIAMAIIARHYVDAIPGALDAFVAGVIAAQRRPKKLWVAIEQLALRSPRVPDALASLVVSALVDITPAIRTAGIGIARIVDARRAIEAALAGELPADHADRLREALAAISRSTELVTRLVEEWRRTRDPALEPLIAVLGREQARLRDPITDASDWLAVAAIDDPADTQRLLDAPRAESPVTQRSLDEAFARRGADPRTTRVSLPTAPANAALVDEAVVAATRATEVERLLADHTANPGDLELREILADALAQVGDPRGEFITVQLAIAEGAFTKAVLAREKELLDAYAARFIGPLPGITSATARFARGFLVEAQCTTSAVRLAASIDRFEWATIETLGLAVERADAAALVARMPLLRKLSTLPDALTALATSGPHPALRIVRAFGTWVPRDRASFPNLAILAGNDTAGEIMIPAAAALDIPVLVLENVGADELSLIVGRRTRGPRIIRATGGRWRIELDRASDHAYLACDEQMFTQWAFPGLNAVVAALGRGDLARLSFHVEGTTRPTDEIEERIGELEAAAGDMELDLEGRRIQLDAIPR